MNFETISAILGLGSIILMIMTTIFEHIERKKMIRFERMTLEKENRYHSILTYMLVILNYKNLSHIELGEESVSMIRNMNPEEIREFFFDKLRSYYAFSHLYASDEVLKNLDTFLSEPSKQNYESVAKAMRRDLWK